MGIKWIKMVSMYQVHTARRFFYPPNIALPSVFSEVATSSISSSSEVDLSSRSHQVNYDATKWLLPVHRATRRSRLFFGCPRHLHNKGTPERDAPWSTWKGTCTLKDFFKCRNTKSCCQFSRMYIIYTMRYKIFFKKYIHHTRNHI